MILILGFNEEQIQLLEKMIDSCCAEDEQIRVDHSFHLKDLLQEKYFLTLLNIEGFDNSELEYYLKKTIQDNQKVFLIQWNKSMIRKSTLGYQIFDDLQRLRLNILTKIKDYTGKGRKAKGISNRVYRILFMYQYVLHNNMKMEEDIIEYVIDINQLPMQMVCKKQFLKDLQLISQFEGKPFIYDRDRGEYNFDGNDIYDSNGFQNNRNCKIEPSQYKIWRLLYLLKQYYLEGEVTKEMSDRFCKDVLQTTPTSLRTFQRDKKVVTEVYRYLDCY